MVWQCIRLVRLSLFEAIFFLRNVLSFLAVWVTDRAFWAGGTVCSVVDRCSSSRIPFVRYGFYFIFMEWVSSFFPVTNWSCFLSIRIQHSPSLFLLISLKFKLLTNFGYQQKRSGSMLAEQEPEPHSIRGRIWRLTRQTITGTIRITIIRKGYTGRIPLR